MSYYHRYRPQQFADLVGQDMVRTILTQALKANELAHAYLFCGTRGTGKTSTARLLAKAVNCPSLSRSGEPCNECELCRTITEGSCLDVVEIDAASNRGIDEIRLLQEQIRFQPQVAKKKIIMIDEVHMLTKEAFNALLKTLEEPPAYLLFILATTEYHKLPATIISRCQRFHFQSPDQQTLKTYLQTIGQAEGLTMEPEALGLIARLSQDSFRDSVTLLEQLAARSKNLTKDDIINTLGLPREELVNRYLTHLAFAADDSLGIDLSAYLKQGGSPTAFIDQLFIQLEENLQQGHLISQATELLGRLVKIKAQMKYSSPVALPLLVNAQISSNAELPKQVGSAQPKAVHQEIRIIALPDEPENQPSANEETVEVAVAEQVPVAELEGNQLGEQWQDLIKRLANDSQSSLVSILRTAEPIRWQPPVLQVSVQFKFHADQLTKQKSRDILEPLLKELLGQPVRLEPEIKPTTDLATVAEELFS